MTLLCIKHGLDHKIHGNATIDCYGEYQLEPVIQSNNPLASVQFVRHVEPVMQSNNPLASLQFKFFTSTILLRGARSLSGKPQLAAGDISLTVGEA